MIEMAAKNCPIWNKAATVEPVGRDNAQIISKRAGGGYAISGTAEAIIKTKDDHVRKKLTTWLVDQRRMGIEFPPIMSPTIAMIERRAELGVLRRAERLLEYLSKSSRFIGDEVTILHDHEDFGEMLAWSESLSDHEVKFLLEYLHENELIALNIGMKLDGSASVTMRGYSKLEEWHDQHANSSQAFVAMWFDQTMDETYRLGIEPAIVEAGYKPVRIDGKEHNNKIDDEIIAEIRRSRFVVADFTHGAGGPRGGVYYEAGFAHGLGKHVIFCCKDDNLSQVHFDTRQYNHIVWSTSEDLRRRLAIRISATLGDGPLKASV
jgi:hypothetical protein